MAVPAVIAAVIAAMLLFSVGDYLPAWFLSIVLAVAALCILSIPRSIRITEKALEIRCVIEITHIPYNHIKELRKVEWQDLKPIVPIFASPGFFGYFGYWLDLSNWDIIKVYASARSGLVIIEDVYERKYLINAPDRDELCRAIEIRRTGTKSEKTTRKKIREKRGPDKA